MNDAPAPYTKREERMSAYQKKLAAFIVDPYKWPVEVCPSVDPAVNNQDLGLSSSYDGCVLQPQRSYQCYLCLLYQPQILDEGNIITVTPLA